MSLNELPNLNPITMDVCPLLAKFGGSEGTSLVNRFNAALEQVRALESDRLIGPLLRTEKFSALLASLVKIRELMSRNRYVVGFIGITQAGKSTTVNNVLGEEVCKAGAMDATSSQPCRIVKAARRSLDVEFLTPALVAERRQKLCEAIGLATPPEDRELRKLIENPEQFRLPEGQERPRLIDDLKYLKEFLLSYEKNKSILTTVAKVQTNLAYEKRYDYTTHARGSASSEVLLLREARFNIDNPRLPEDLELCDLPGLDSKRTIDDVVTWEYLPSLHGTFLFVNAGSNFLTVAILEILAKFGREFRGKIGGRAWVIFNKMDSLTGDSFRPGGQDNIFGTIARFLEKSGIPETQVCFASKKIWDAAVKAGGTADPAAAASTMCQPVANPIPDSCPPGLRTAWQELLKDGGVSLIRRLMFQDVAVTLAAQIRTDVDQKVEEFAREFTAKVTAEQKRSTMNQSDLQAAMTCYYAVLNLRVALATRLAEFPVLVRETEVLRHALGELFVTGATPEVLAHLSQMELAHQFRTHGRVLDQTLEGKLPDIIERVYEEVGKQLEGLPEVPVGPTQQGCREAWKRMYFEDRAELDWLTVRPRFTSSELVDWLAHPTADGVAGEVYVEMMREKIDAAARQTAHLLRSRLRQRLSQLIAELAQLTGAKDANAA
jgi:hypothetical protein